MLEPSRDSAQEIPPFGQKRTHLSLFSLTPSRRPAARDLLHLPSLSVDDPLKTYKPTFDEGKSLSFQFAKSEHAPFFAKFTPIEGSLFHVTITPPKDKIFDKAYLLISRSGSSALAQKRVVPLNTIDNGLEPGSRTIKLDTSKKDPREEWKLVVKLI